MIRLPELALAPALLLVAVPAQAIAAPLENRFDGTWSVVAMTETGSCRGPYHYPIVIRGGTVDEASGNAADASGRAGSDGRIAGTIRQGPATIAVSGRLRGSAGKGRWILDGLASCAGRWTARRTG
ncbi:hypothetical protein [Methylobacterium radiodurans]|uniref:Large exoprotein involved in heme utilization or adhesion n=1 Tax=Methylobacterium radiodurans TaxID=2202828 RepID=A0A2U8VYW3_9HYPH|nr:hypothetical protein [Methylobacterium radiodurans]AWN38450.1 hypothetical protein DK427_24210 [Methylobacterium radiodurans]